MEMLGDSKLIKRSGHPAFAPEAVVGAGAREEAVLAAVRGEAPARSEAGLTWSGSRLRLDRRAGLGERVGAGARGC